MRRPLLHHRQGLHPAQRARRRHGRLAETPAWPSPAPPSAGTFDLVVVGGGVAGCSAALTAARLGLDVALVQDRPVLGGNASSEIRIHPAGFDRSIVAEVASPNRAAVIQAEKRIHLYLSWQAFGVEMEGSRIAGVDAKHTSSGKELRFRAPLFVDSTGDGWIGYWAGADFRMGRESREEFGESMAPPEADKMTHGSTLYFKVDLADAPTTFPDVPWAQAVSGTHVDLRSDHSWEYGHRLNMIDDAEQIRDHLLCAVYGTFATAKKKFATATAAKNARLARVDYIAARGESRRLMGDHILTENEIKSKHPFPDGVAQGGLVFCLHYPGQEHDFRSQLKLTAVEPYLIPFRSLYSRNVDNLMMAGRDASATHIAYSSIKLMKTGGQMGVAVGAAAMLAKKYGVAPRGVYEHHVEELKNIVFARPPYKDALKPKDDRPTGH
ncbi:MAG: FAD-dependent oxidoreductase [Planctomycetes bacterium]|nr:FAD-dependent oxidoreductase [Planctomycetota bacterium]